MIATLLFTYHRFKHTKRVLEALEQNTHMPEKLIIFQDGVKETTNLYDWHKVNDYIKNVDFCEKEVIVSPCNKGLANSIIQGVDYAFETYDKVIVLEDDCVPAGDFINFMEQAFSQYERQKEVWSVSGYAWPLNLVADRYDIYFTGRVSSWGWGTWKDRWNKFSRNYQVMDKILENDEKRLNLLRWGKDLEPMLEDRKKGKNDSWAVFWALLVIEENGKCVVPYKSLIRNIGNDGSGTNCAVTNRYDVKLDKQKDIQYRFPTTVVFDENVCEKFTELYGSKFVKACKTENGFSILVYGAGRYMRKHDSMLYDEYNVLAIIDRDKTGQYGCIPIIKVNQIKKYHYDYIVIMIQNDTVCGEIKNMLVQKYKVSGEKIVYGKDLLKEG